MLMKIKLIRDKEIYERIDIGAFACKGCKYYRKENKNTKDDYCRKFKFFADSLCGPRFHFRIVGYGISDKIKYEYRCI